MAGFEGFVEDGEWDCEGADLGVGVYAGEIGEEEVSD